MVTLSAWKCGSYLYGIQEFEVYLYPTRFEYEAEEMVRVDQGLWARSALSLEKGEYGCGCVELQGSLQLLTRSAFYWRGIQHLSVIRFVIVQHYPHTYFEE
jgi:hypothetical protein